MNRTYFFYGFGAEYVLHPLYEEIRKRGEDAIEIDALTKSDCRLTIKKLKGSDIIFITSAHLLMDQKNFTDFYPTNKKFYSVLEIIALIKPIKTIFIPHDLTQPLIDYEKDYLNQLDLFLSPIEPYTSIYSQYVKTEQVGWIKYLSKTINLTKKTEKTSRKAIWFLSDYVLHQKIGPEASFLKLAPILEQKVAIKFPIWFDTEIFESYFREKGIEVYPASTNTSTLIQNHDIIITNGLSSLIAESYLMGKTVVNVMEGSHYGDILPYLKSTFPEILFIENIVDFDKATIPIKARPVSLKPFDMETAIKLITSNWEHNTKS